MPHPASPCSVPTAQGLQWASWGHPQGGQAPPGAAAFPLVVVPEEAGRRFQVPQVPSVAGCWMKRRCCGVGVGQELGGMWSGGQGAGQAEWGHQLNWELCFGWGVPHFPCQPWSLPSPELSSETAQSKGPRLRCAQGCGGLMGTQDTLGCRRHRRMQDENSLATVSPSLSHDPGPLCQVLAGLSPLKAVASVAAWPPKVLYFQRCFASKRCFACQGRVGAGPSATHSSAPRRPPVMGKEQA